MESAAPPVTLPAAPSAAPMAEHGGDMAALGAAIANCNACGLCEGRRNTVFGVEALLRWDSKLLGKLSPAQFIAPFFVAHGKNVRRPIASMPGQFQLSVDQLLREAAAAVDLGEQRLPDGGDHRSPPAASCTTRSAHAGATMPRLTRERIARTSSRRIPDGSADESSKSASSARPRAGCPRAGGRGITFQRRRDRTVADPAALPPKAPVIISPLATTSAIATPVPVNLPAAAPEAVPVAAPIIKVESGPASIPASNPASNLVNTPASGNMEGVGSYEPPSLLNSLQQLFN